MTRYWTCQRKVDGIPCRQRNQRVKQRCIRCGGPRPKARIANHMVALQAPYEYYVEITGGERCAICLRPRAENEKRLHRDHCHRTGRPRGLLCWKCNGALPHWITPEWLRAAAAYLERAAA